LPILVFLFLIVPFIEIYLLIQVGQQIGALPTIALCVLTAVIGGFLLRQQGARTLQRARRSLDRGELPAGELLEGLALAVGGALLVTPGFATDAVGFVCLIPHTRAWLVGEVLKRVTVIRAGSAPRGPGRTQKGHEVIEGEYRRHD
jgi:UPF0716 protein FxsA